MSIGLKGLRFVDITEENPYWQKQGVPDLNFGVQLASRDYPLAFQYKATDSVSSFTLMQIDGQYNTVNETSLSTSLITSNGVYHICTGTVEYGIILNKHVYYFKVNDRYFSDIFAAFDPYNRGIGYDIIEQTLVVY
jgi:hypothetical protein